MTSLVIGGAGFIGSHLCDELLAAGDRVVCVDNLSLGRMENLAHLKDHTVFTFERLDVVSEEDRFRKLVKAVGPDYVFHLAANSDIQASAKNPAVEYRNTYTTTFNVLSVMRECGIRNLFFASTSAVYGDKKDTLLDENTPNLSPISYYGAAKLGSEALISAFTYMNDLHSLVFRFPNVIGPRLTHGVVHDFIGKLTANPKQLEILGDGRQTKPYIYVKDLVKAIVRFREVPQGVTLYNLGVDGATSVTRIADIICEEMGLSDVEYRYTGGEGGWKGDVPRFHYDLTKIHSTGWKAEYDSDEAVRLAARAAVKELREGKIE